MAGEPLDPHLRRILITIGWMLIAVGAIHALSLLKPLLSGIVGIASPFLAGALLAYLFNPVVTMLEKRLRVSRGQGVVLLIVGLALVLAVFMAVIVPTLYRQVTSAASGITETVPRKVQELLDEHHVTLGGLRLDATDWVSSNTTMLQSAAVDALKNPGVHDAAKSAATGGFEILAKAFSAVAQFLGQLTASAVFASFTVLVAIYLLLDLGGARRVFSILLPDRIEPRAFEVLGKVDEAVGGYLRGQTLDCAIVGFLTFIAMTLLGLKQYALLIGFAAGIGNAIPYAGTVCGAIPAVLYMLISDAHEGVQSKLLFAGAVVVAFAIIQAIDGFLLQPRVVGKSAQLHPIAVLFAIAVGAQAGLLGIFFAVPTACVARVLLKEFYWDKRVLAWEKAQREREKGSS